MERVAVIYPYFAHYRGPIIEELLNEEELKYYFFAGNKTNKALSSLRLYDFDVEDRFVLLKNTWFFKYFLIQCGIISNIRRKKINAIIVLSDWKYISYWFLLLFCKLTNRKCLFWSHGLLNNKKSINNRVKYLFHSLFDGGVVYSKRSKNILEQYGFKKPLLVINNSLNYSYQQQIISSIKKDKYDVIEKPYLIFTGRLIPERELEILFDSLSILNQKGVRVNLLIIGQGPHEKNLFEKVKRNNIESLVKFYGPCYDEEILGYYFTDSLACVFPGAIGLTIVHAFTYGVPVITNDDLDTQKPEVEALIDGENGYFFKKNDSSDLADKILLLLRQNSEKREKFKLKAKEVVKKRYTPTYQKKVLREMIKLVKS